MNPGLNLANQPYRLGNILVVPAGAQLPPNCVKCGAPVSQGWLNKKFRWHEPWLYVLAIIALLLYAIVALIIQKTVQLAVPFCDEHRAWRRKMNILGAVLLIGALPVAFLLAAVDADGAWIALFSLGMGIGGLIVLVVVGASFAPVKITDFESRFKGAREPFLALLPEGPPQTSILQPPAAPATGSFGTPPPPRPE